LNLCREPTVPYDPPFSFGEAFFLLLKDFSKIFLSFGEAFLKGSMVSIFIFRRDLRYEDNNALNILAKLELPIIPIFIFNPIQADKSINKYFSQKAFDLLTKCVNELNIEIYRGDDVDILTKLNKKIDIKYIGFNLDYTPFAKKRDGEIIKWCEKNDIKAITSEDYTILKLVEIKPYKVFTPFWKKYGLNEIPRPTTHKNVLNNLIDASGKKIKINETPTREIAKDTMKKRYDDYSDNRDNMFADKTTHLSKFIKFGVISIREVYHTFASKYGKECDLIRELFWRDFYAMNIHFFPELLAGQIGKKNETARDEPKWSYAKVKFEKWCNGETGFPIVDAAMKQLAATGWMHNRARMIVATFLTKDLHIDWREGERFFAQHLIDYDPSSNNGGWQWCASTGYDCQPYFRIFSPWRQTQTNDPEAKYIKFWLPEFKDIPADDIINWQSKYKKYDYIAPMVKHEEESEKAIELFKRF
jgi:deoxyribodipyrimidine photo-lyase